MITDEDQHALCEDIALDMLTDIGARSFPDIGAKIEQSLFVIAFTVHRMSERKLIEYLAVAGIDLTDQETWDMASDYVTWYVGTKAIDLHDVYAPSLTGNVGGLLIRALSDVSMQERIKLVTQESVYFRRFMVAEVDVLA